MAQTTATKCAAWASDAGNLLRVEKYMLKASEAVMGEDYGGAEQPTEYEHGLRVEYSKTIMGGTADISKMALGVTNNSTVQTAIGNNNDVPDSDVEFSVNERFSDYSGYDKDPV